MDYHQSMADTRQAWARYWGAVMEPFLPARTWSDDWHYWAKASGLGQIDGVPAIGGW